MSDKSIRAMSDSLRLTAEERENLADGIGELVAIQVYRELQIRNKLAEVAGCSIIGNCSNGSCDIIGNCSSSSKDAIVQALKPGPGQ